MKTIKHVVTGEIRRLRDYEAHFIVSASDEWKFIPKREWKESCEKVNGRWVKK